MRILRIIGLALGVAALFSVTAYGGWALAGTTPPEGLPWATAEFVENAGGVQVPTEAFAAYPVAPADDQAEGDLKQRTVQLAATTSYLSSSSEPNSGLGAAAAGGQVFIATQDSPPGSVEPPDSALPDQVPVEVFESEPFLHPLIPELVADRDLGLNQQVVLDICAGMVPGRTPPSGCPTFGFGGTIVALSLSTLDPVKISIGVPDASPSCRSDDSTFRMRVVTNRPGRIQSTMWNIGPGTGNDLNQPPDAAVTFGATPADLDTEWYTSLDNPATTETPGIRFCMEVPIRVDVGVVQHAVLFTSTHPPDDEELVVATAGFLHTGAVERRRPPTGFTAFGRDTLYVRAFRNSESGTTTFVQARNRLSGSGGEPIEVCQRPLAEFDIEGVPQESYSLDTSGDDWPWGREWDVMDVHGLPLNGSTVYAVCIYELDDTGLVVYAEAADVWTPWTRTVRVTVDAVTTANVSPDPEIVAFTIDGSAGCSPYVRDWPGPNQLFIEFAGTEPPVLCFFQHTGNLVTNSGFVVDISLDRVGPTESDFLRGWVSIPRSDLLCRVACGANEFITLLPLPAVSDGESERPAGEVQLTVILGDPGGIEEWRFGYPFPFLNRP